MIGNSRWLLPRVAVALLALQLLPLPGPVGTARATASESFGIHRLAFDFDALWRRVTSRPAIVKRRRPVPSLEALASSCPSHDAELAIRACSAAIASGRFGDERLAILYYDRANAYRRKGRSDDAIRDFDRAIQLKPDFTLAYNNRGNAYSDTQNYDQAIWDYEAALQLDPNFALAFYNRGLAYAAEGAQRRAIHDFDRAIALDPGNALSFNGRGNANLALGEYDLALRDFEAAMRLDPDLAYAKRGRERTVEALQFVGASAELVRSGE